MAVIHKNGYIILTEKDGESFHNKMKYPDPEVAKKRDAYIKHAQENVKIIHKEKGRMVVQVKELGEW